MPHRHRFLFCLLLLAGIALGLPLRAAETTYRVGVVPQFEPRKLFAIWRPILDEVSRKSGVRLELRGTLGIEEFEHELARGDFDFVYANPFLILRESKRQGYLPLVRDRTPLRGILVVHRDSPLRSPAELDGQKLAVPSINALGASLLLRADLEQRFKARPVPVDVKTHSSVYLQVASGQIAAGGGVEKTLQEQDPKVRQLLRVLHTTRDMPSHPIAVHPRVPLKARQAVQQALLDLARSQSGQELLDRIPMQQPVATSLQDYQAMRHWGLDRFWHSR